MMMPVAMGVFMLVVVTVAVVLSPRCDPELGRADAAPIDAVVRHADPIKTERVDDPRQLFERHPGIYQRTGDHVARGAREAVEKQYPRHRPDG